jgi:hypothetical protein
MGLTIEAIGVYNAPVFDSDSQWALATGGAHVPETSLPWSPSAQRNVYLAGHRMGFRGTWSRMTLPRTLPDAEEVSGSNPISPTLIYPGNENKMKAPIFPLPRLAGEPVRKGGGWGWLAQ